MTEPLSRVSTIKETGKKKAPDTRLKHEKNTRHAQETDEDCVEISEEARERSAGKKRRDILDYLNEEHS